MTASPTGASLDAFAEVVRRHQTAVCAAAYGVTGDRALSEDVAQDTFLVAWRTQDQLRDATRMRPWLRGIARNLAHKARRKRRPLEELPELAAEGDPGRDAVERDDARVAWAALRALPAPYREALALYYWGDQSAREVAEALGISVAGAMQRLSRGRALLRKEVERGVEGTLSRARPALTAAILAAIAATSSQAEAASGGFTISRRLVWQSGLSLVAIRALRGLRAGPFGASGTEPPVRAGAEGTPMPQRSTVEPALPATPSTPDDLDETDLSESMSAVVTSDDGPSGWVTGEIHSALSVFFVEELADRPCRLDVEVAGGAIARAQVARFDGDARRVVVRAREPTRAILAPADLPAWLAADRLIEIIAEPVLAADAALTTRELLALCAQARLVGLPVAGPDGARRLSFGWREDARVPVDARAYVALGVADGLSCGPLTAPVTTVAFVDLADPWGFGCEAVRGWIEVAARYAQAQAPVRVVIKPCPLTDDRWPTAEAVHAAHAQGALWPMLERLAAGPVTALDELVDHADALGIDAARLRDDLVRRVFRAAVERDRAHMAAMAINSLPSAIVLGRRVHGALPVATYLGAVERALRAAATRVWP